MFEATEKKLLKQWNRGPRTTPSVLAHPIKWYFIRKFNLLSKQLPERSPYHLPVLLETLQHTRGYPFQSRHLDLRVPKSLGGLNSDQSFLSCFNFIEVPVEEVTSD